MDNYTFEDSGFNQFLERPIAKSSGNVSSLDFESNIESVPASLLSGGKIIAGNLTIDLDNGTITSSDNSNIRLYINSGVFKVSKVGFNADITGEENLIYSSGT